MPLYLRMEALLNFLPLFPLLRVSERKISSGRNATRVAAALLIALLVYPGVSSFPVLLAQDKGSLNIRLLRGSGQVIKKGDSLQLIVEVRDDTSVIRGAEVTFIAPEFGPGVLFAGNVDRLTVKTDINGRANSGPTRSVGGQGPFTVTVVAMSQDNSGSTTAQASNQSGGASNPGSKKSKKLMWILIAAGGIAAGAFVAMSKSEGSDSGSGSLPGSTVTITGGSPTVGAPQ